MRNCGLRMRFCGIVDLVGNGSGMRARRVWKSEIVRAETCFMHSRARLVSIIMRASAIEVIRYEYLWLHTGAGYGPF